MQTHDIKIMSRVVELNVISSWESCLEWRMSSMIWNSSDEGVVGSDDISRRRKGFMRRNLVFLVYGLFVGILGAR